MAVRKPSVKIVNIVASAALNQRINLKQIVQKFPQAEYSPHVFPGLVFRLKKPKTATLIFETGKMVCTGAKSEKEAAQAVTKVTKELKKHGIPIASKPVVTIQNVVASAELGGEIDLESVVYKLKRVMYSLNSSQGQFTGWQIRKSCFSSSRLENLSVSARRGKRMSTAPWTIFRESWKSRGSSSTRSEC